MESTTRLQRGASIGRYVVLRQVGAGAMGEVYAAYDPELERKVAIKLLRLRRSSSSDTSDSKTRLLREAQAIAKLSHPNVIVVHDIGSIADRVFIAMEYIDGSTLTFWVNAAPRTWREILRVFVAAGRGLQAAHEANLVHRDFKPDNVMVGADGQVRVMDFGLVRHVDVRPDAVTASIAGEPSLDATMNLGKVSVDDLRRAGAEGPLNAKLTQTGAMMGTPAYMAPEQFRGEQADARTDQFSFCVALYEALFGQRPFVGTTLAELASNVLTEEPRPPPDGTPVPTWVRRVVLRGLSLSPDERFPSMRELVAELERTPTSRRRYIVAGAVAVALVATGVAVRGAAPGQRSICRVPFEKLQGVWETSGWNTPRRTAIEAAFKRTGKDHASAAFNGVATVLDKFVGDWAAMYTNACEATNVLGNQSAEVLDLRMSCLEDRLVELRALSDVFVEPSGDIVENATQAAMGIGPLERCADLNLLRGFRQAPRSATAATAVQVVRADLAAAKAMEDAGRSGAAISAMLNVVTNARNTGYRPLIAEALCQAGQLYLERGDPAAAEPLLTEAITEAQASQQDEVLIQAMSALIAVRGSYARDMAGADVWRRMALASLERIGGNDRLRARALRSWGTALAGARRYAEALKAEEEALAVGQRAFGPAHAEVAVSCSELAGIHARLGEFQKALALSDRALKTLEGTLGRDHPRLGKVLLTRAEIMAGLGRFAESKQAAERSRAVWTREPGAAQHPLLAHSLAAIGIAEVALGDTTAAVPPLTDAVAWADASRRGGTAIPMPEARLALSKALWATHRGSADAINLARLALAEVNAFENRTPRDETLRAAIEQWCGRVGALPARGELVADTAGAEPAPPAAAATGKGLRARR